MKKVFATFALIIAVVFTSTAQEVKTIELEQTKGEFTQKELKLTEGQYIFNISNNNSGTDVGFVVVPEGTDASNPDNHIKEAYVTQVVAEGQTQSTQTVTLEKGTYKYFCPLNKTPQYTLVVE